MPSSINLALTGQRSELLELTRAYQVSLGDPAFGQAPNDRTGNASPAVQAALDALRNPLTVGGSGSFNYRNWYGGTLYIPGGIYNLNSTITQSSTVANDRIGLRIKGDGMRTSVLYTETLQSVLDIAASGMFIALEDLSIVVYTDLSAASSGAPARVLKIVGALGVYLNRVQVYLRTAGNENLWAQGIYLQDCFYSVLNACRTDTFSPQAAQGVKHSVSGSTTFARLSGTHIYSKNNNALVVQNHTWGNPHRCMTLEDDDGVVVQGGSAEWFNQGFALIGSSSLNAIRDVRFEAHPETSHKYLGNGEHWLCKFGERTFDNYFECRVGANLPVDTTRNGVVDLSGANSFVTSGLARPLNARSFTPNGTGAAAHSTVWTASGTATLTTITSDLPPEQAIVSTMELAVTGNVAGATMAAFAVDPERLPAFVFRYWMKRVSGQQQMRYMLESNVSGQYLATDLSRSAVTAHLLNGKALSVSGATWAGGVATYTTDMDAHWLVANQLVTVAGITPAGYNVTAQPATVLSATQFSLPLAGDPGGAGGAGTATRVSYDSEFADLSAWAEVRGVFTIRRVITGVSANGTQVTYTLNGPHRIPNNTGCQFKAWGLSIPGFNGTFNVVSTTSTTVTVANTTTGTPAAGFDGVALGWGGYFGNLTVRFGNEGSGSATWRIAGVQHFQGNERCVALGYAS